MGFGSVFYAVIVSDYLDAPKSRLQGLVRASGTAPAMMG
jgi:hypothetical protein